MAERVGIGTYRCTVIDVTDLDAGYRFWSEVTGLEIIGRTPGGWHGRLTEVTNCWQPLCRPLQNDMASLVGLLPGDFHFWVTRLWIE